MNTPCMQLSADNEKCHAERSVNGVDALCLPESPDTLFCSKPGSWQQHCKLIKAAKQSESVHFCCNTNTDGQIVTNLAMVEYTCSVKCEQKGITTRQFKRHTRWAIRTDARSAIPSKWGSLRNVLSNSKLRSLRVVRQCTQHKQLKTLSSSYHHCFS